MFIQEIRFPDSKARFWDSVSAATFFYITDCAEVEIGQEHFIPDFFPIFR